MIVALGIGGRGSMTEDKAEDEDDRTTGVVSRGSMSTSLDSLTGLAETQRQRDRLGPGYRRRCLAPGPTENCAQRR